jgi:hypothetical protein
MKEYHRIDMTTGERLDVLLFSDEQVVPEDCKLGWGGDRSFYNPIWDFEVNDWVESMPFEQIIAPIKELKEKQIYDECQDAIKAGFEFEGDYFGFTDVDQDNFNQQLSLLLLDPTTEEVEWMTLNNGLKMFPKDKFIQACKAGEAHKRNNISHYRDIVNYINSHTFTSREELYRIDFSFKVDTDPTVTTGTSE